MHDSGVKLTLNLGCLFLAGILHNKLPLTWASYRKELALQSRICWRTNVCSTG